MCDLAAMTKVSTRDLEGCNSIIKWMGKVAPNMSFPLMRARFVAKTFLDSTLPREARESSSKRQQVLDIFVPDHKAASA